MRSLSAVRLKSGSPDSLDAKSPSILFYYSDASVAKGDKSVPTPQAKLSDDVEQDLFGGKSAQVGVLARRFSLVKVNVTSVSPKEDAAFNGLSAPVIVVKASDGSRVAALRGKVSEGALVGAMIAALKKDNINGAQILSKGTGALNVIRKMVDEKLRLRQNLAQIAEKMKDETGGKAQMLQQRETQLKGELEKVEKALKDAYDQLKAANDTA